LAQGCRLSRRRLGELDVINVRGRRRSSGG
jgi:hypothetical protein